MTAENSLNPAGSPLENAQSMIEQLNQELIAANTEFVALTLELEERMEQLQITNQRLAQEITERRRIEAMLQASELRFRALVENSSDIVMLVDYQGICIYVSPSIERLLGYAPTDVEGNSFIAHVHPTERENFWHDFQRSITQPGQEISLSYRCRSASGEWRYLEGVSCNRLHEAAVAAIVINVRDVTARKRAEVHIHRMNRTLERQVSLRTAQLQVAFDFEATLKRITDKVRDSLDEDHILQTAVEELARAIGVPCCNAAVYDLEQGTSAIRYEYSTSHEYHPGHIIQMANFSEGYDQLLQGQHFQMCSLRPNPKRGRVAMLACPILDDEGVMGDLWLIHQAEHRFHDQDIRLVQQVANQCAIALRQSRLYQTARAQVQELERLNRLKDDFLSTVSHELRAPMTNIKMSSQMLAIQLQSLDIEVTGPVNRYISILQDECQREISLINDLLDLARLDAESEHLELISIPVPEKLSALTESFLERIQNQQQQLILDVPPELPALVSHDGYVNRMLMELLNNACKYTPKYERIIVSARVLAEPKYYKKLINSIASEKTTLVSYLKICVTNTGVEIPPKERDRIFDKFYRIPNNDPWRHGGTGLGLALVKKLAERLGCTLQLEHEPQQTTFSLLFPLH